MQELIHRVKDQADTLNVNGTDKILVLKTSQSYGYFSLFYEFCKSALFFGNVVIYYTFLENFNLFGIWQFFFSTFLKSIEW